MMIVFIVYVDVIDWEFFFVGNCVKFFEDDGVFVCLVVFYYQCNFYGYFFECCVGLFVECYWC